MRNTQILIPVPRRKGGREGVDMKAFDNLIGWKTLQSQSIVGYPALVLRSRTTMMVSEE